VSFYNESHIQFSTELSKNEYVAIGFSKYMMDCEMLSLETNPLGAVLYFSEGKGHNTPLPKENQDLTFDYFLQPNGKYVVTALKPLEPEDPEDFNFPKAMMVRIIDIINILLRTLIMNNLIR